jgi:DNA-binding CsgD family transcriptional regulator
VTENPALVRRVLSERDFRPCRHTLQRGIITNKQIADEMFLAEKTVKNDVSNVLAKMGMSRRSDAAAHVVRVQAEKEGSALPESWG